MFVRDLMSTDLVVVDVETSLAEAARTMVSAGVGSALVTRDGTPTGIVTETDALAAGASADEPFEDIPLEAAMSSPLETVQPDVTVRAAVQRMEDVGVKKLPVADGVDFLGIVTMTDVVLGYHDILREAHDLEARRED